MGYGADAETSEGNEESPALPRFGRERKMTGEGSRDGSGTVLVATGGRFDGRVVEEVVATTEEHQ